MKNIVFTDSASGQNRGKYLRQFFVCVDQYSHRDVTRKLSISIVGQSFRSRYLWGTTNKSFQPETSLPTGADEGVQGVRTPLRWPAAHTTYFFRLKKSKAKQKQNKTKKKPNKNKRRWGHFLVVCPSWEKSWIRPWPIPTDKSIYHGFSQTIGHTFPAVSNMWKITSSPSMSTRCWYQLSIDKISNFWYFCWRLTKCQQLLYLRL